MADDPAGGWLTQQQVADHAVQLGLGGWRTVERHIADGLVDGGRRVRGQGRKPPYRYPPTVVAQRHWVKTRLEAAAQDGRRAPSPTRLLYRRWWESAEPHLSEPWRRDPLRCTWRQCKGWAEDRARAPDDLDRQGAVLAEDWGRRRDWRHRKRMRGADRRAALAAAIVATGPGRPGDVRLDDALDPTILPGEPGDSAVGAALEHAMRLDRARRARVAIPRPPGARARDVLGW